MKHTYKIDGMTCGGCKASVGKYLSNIDGVSSVSVDLEHGAAVVEMNTHIAIETFQQALPSKYTISEDDIFNTHNSPAETVEEKSKLQQLKPLLLILLFIVCIGSAINYPQFVIKELMLDFMGLFFMIFSLFKFFDLVGFATSFSMYDPLAKVVKPYGYIYPFIEVALGILFLMRVEISVLLIITLIILTITTFGVTRSLLRKDEIKCACLGTVLNLPMTEATFIENSIMIIMALLMITSWV